MTEIDAALKKKADLKDLAARAEDKYYKIALTVSGGGVALLATVGSDGNANWLFFISLSCFVVAILGYLLEAREVSLACRNNERALWLSSHGILEWVEFLAVGALFVGVVFASIFAFTGWREKGEVTKNDEVESRAVGRENTERSAQGSVEETGSPTPRQAPDGKRPEGREKVGGIIAGNCLAKRPRRPGIRALPNGSSTTAMRTIWRAEALM